MDIKNLNPLIQRTMQFLYMDMCEWTTADLMRSQSVTSYCNDRHKQIRVLMDMMVQMRDVMS